ncbi:MAG: hypothetical protein WCO58_01435 [bacterium]
MSIRNQFNQHNGNTRNQGGVNSWIADVDAEVYQNIDQLESQINTNQNQTQTQFNGHEQRLQSNSNQINDHENKLNTHQGIINNIQNDLISKQNEISQILNTELPTKQSSIDTINNRLVDYEKKMTDYDTRIFKFNESALEKLAEAYTNMADGELKTKEDDARKNGLKQDRDFWLKLTKYAFLIIIVYDIFVVLSKIIFHLTYQEMLSMLALDLVGFTVLYFIVAQYSYYKKLYMEYKNREVVAKSYLGVLNNAETNEHERGIITQIVADTLFTRNVADQGADLPVKEAIRIVEKTAESTSNIIKNKV